MTSVCDPDWIGGELRFFTTGTIRSRTRLTQSRISTHELRTSSSEAVFGSGSARHIRCSFAIGPPSSAGSVNVDQIMARYFGLTFDATATSFRDRKSVV